MKVKKERRKPFRVGSRENGDRVFYNVKNEDIYKEIQDIKKAQEKLLNAFTKHEGEENVRLSKMQGRTSQNTYLITLVGGSVVALFYLVWNSLVT